MTQGSRQTDQRDRDGPYGRLDEELATLPSAYSNSKWDSERYGMRHGTEEIEGRKDVAATTILVNDNTPSGW